MVYKIMMNLKLILIKIVLIILAILINSCATTQKVSMTTNDNSSRGVWHRIREGQTLWRIAKTYHVSLEELKEINEIEDVVHVRQGTWIFIPNAKKVLYVQGNINDAEVENTRMNFIWPIKGEVVKSFGKIGKDYNYGIDIKTRANENVVATMSGVVVLSGLIRGYGDTIIIEHDHDFCSLYSRNIKSLVNEGQTIEKSNVIAKFVPIKKSSKEIMHYELFYKGKPVNPLYYLP